MIRHVGFPKCVCGSPFTLVKSPAEYRAWVAENGEVKIASKRDNEIQVASEKAADEVKAKVVSDLEAEDKAKAAEVKAKEQSDKKPAKAKAVL